MPKANQPVVGVERIAPSLMPLRVPVASLKFDPQNARLHPEESIEVIAASLAKYGQKKTIVVRKETMTVVAGNGTLEAALKLGWKYIAANVESMTDAEATGYGIVDNRSAEMSKWDYQILSRIGQTLEDLGDPALGWSHDQLVAMRLGEFLPESDYEVTQEDFLECPECGHLFPPKKQVVNKKGP